MHSCDGNICTQILNFPRTNSPNMGVSKGEQNKDKSVLDSKRILYIGRNRPIRISTGHRIMHHDGKCSRPHGHNYQIKVKIEGDISEEGWIVDKGKVTNEIYEWDHKFLVEDGDPLIDAFTVSGDEEAVIILDHPPTAEVMSIELERRLLDTLPNNVDNVNVEVSETGELSSGGLRED